MIRPNRMNEKGGFELSTAFKVKLTLEQFLAEARKHYVPNKYYTIGSSSLAFNLVFLISIILFFFTAFIALFEKASLWIPILLEVFLILAYALIHVSARRKAYE